MIRSSFLARTTVFTAILVAAVSAIAANDTLVLKDDETFVGTFEGYKNGRFYFKPNDAKKRKYFTSLKVEALNLKPPADVSVKPRGKKKMKDLKLKGYIKPEFVLEKDGKELRMAGIKISIIEMGMNLARMMEIATDTPPATDNKEPVEVEELLKKNAVTIIHFQPNGEAFTPKSRAASNRTGNYLESLDKKYRSKVEVVLVPITRWKDASALKYSITSLPQFWFYNPKGKLSSKLVERFTSDDIDQALKAARR